MRTKFFFKTTAALLGIFILGLSVITTVDALKKSFDLNRSYFVYADEGTAGEGTNGEEATDEGAAGDNGLNPSDLKRPSLDSDYSQDWVGLVRKFISYLLLAAAIIAVVVIIFAGYIYITSAGSPEKAKIGQSALIGAVIGLVITFIAYAIIAFIDSQIINTTTNGSGGSSGGNGGVENDYIEYPALCGQECPEKNLESKEVDWCICGGNFAGVPCVTDYVLPGESCGNLAEQTCKTDEDCPSGLTCTEVSTSNSDWCTNWQGKPPK